ncbi:hypothetical protein T439DRAFT_381558 [Meredithblackwellia eburnea MCA 4105]
MTVPLATRKPSLPTQPGFVVLSPEEKESGKWSRANLQRAMELLHRDGLLGMTGIVEIEHLEKLRDSMLKTTKEIKASKTKLTDFNHGVATNFLQSPPLNDPELLYPDVFNNQFVHQIVQQYLGPGIQLAFITANAALSNTHDRQPVHKDAPFHHPLAPYSLNTNFPLMDFTPENGSTEFWLGTHSQTTNEEQLWRSKEHKTPTCNVIPAIFNERAQVRPGEQLRVPFGTVLLRDMRTWHAGMPNVTDEDRIMIAVGYTAAWYPPAPQRFKAPLSAKPLLTSSPLVTPILDFIPDEKWVPISQKWGLDVEDGIQLPSAPGMGQDPEFDGKWTTLNNTRVEDKVVDENYNPSAL